MYVTKNRFAPSSGTVQGLVNVSYSFSTAKAADMMFWAKRSSKDWIKLFLRSLGFQNFMFHEPMYVEGNIIHFMYKKPEQDQVEWQVFSNYSSLKECFGNTFTISPPTKRAYGTTEEEDSGDIVLFFDDLEAAGKIAKMKIVLDQLNDVL